MKKALGLVLIIFLSFYFYSNSDNQTDHSHEEHSSHEGDKKNQKKKPSPFFDNQAVKASPLNKTKKTDLKKPKIEAPAKIPDFEPKSDYEVSLSKMGDLVRDVVKKTKTSKSLREQAIVLGLKPITSNDSNPYTGKMTIVRTKSNLPGTRYLHAQFFESAEGNEVLQYIGYDYKKGPKAFETAMAASAQKFGIKSAPTAQRAGFVKWDIGDGRNLWIKELNAEELKSDPFNAYSSEDVGTVRVVVELEIHHGDDEHEHIEPVEN